MTTKEQGKRFSLDKIIGEFAAGKAVIITDDENRENEGDLVVATELITPEMIAFMMKHCRGLICVSISSEVADHLALSLQTFSNGSRFGTPFALSIDHYSVVGKGNEAASRATTIRELANSSSKASDFVVPGHVFPLLAHPHGVLGRRGQTEASFDLARLAGKQPSGVICEILNPDGTLTRGQQLVDFAEQHGFQITSVEEIAKYRIENEAVAQLVTSQEVETDFGLFNVHVFQDQVEHKEHLALTYGKLSSEQKKHPILCRIHSECLTGDVLGSLRCDCGPQLALAMQKIVEEGAGVIIYLRQEGRGIGLGNKMRAYALQDHGADTVDANIKLGFEVDKRDYVIAANILRDLEIKRIKLMTNNPEKLRRLSSLGIEISERIEVKVEPDSFNSDYLRTKRERMGHLL